MSYASLPLRAIPQDDVDVWWRRSSDIASAAGVMFGCAGVAVALWVIVAVPLG